MSDLKKSIFSNFFWRFAERVGARSVQLIVELILARLLVPSVYGVIALVTVFTSIMQVFIDSGLGNALIQKKNADDLDYSSVFYFNMAVCLVLYGLMFVFAPLIASFYGMTSLVKVIRVLSLTLIISGIKNVQQAYVSRNLLFKKFFFSTIGGTIGAAGIGIWMAYNGYGVWALVAQHLFNTTIDTLILWISVKWRPKMMFSFSRLKEMFSYGWKMLVSALIDTTYNDLRQLIIGKLYTSSDLAFYNRGNQIPALIISNVNTAIDSVLFPTMSKEQDDRNRIKAMTRRAISISTYIMAPMMVGLAICAEPLVRLILTDKWLPCVPYLRIFCIIYTFYPIHTANLNAIKALGRSDLFLKLEIVKKIVGLIVLFSTIWFGVLVMAYSLLLTSVTSQIINSWPNRRLLNYPFGEQIRDIMPAGLLALGMGAIVYCVEMLHLHDLPTLIIQFFIGVAVYVGGSVLFHMESFYYLIGVFKRFQNGNK